MKRILFLFSAFLLLVMVNQTAVAQVSASSEPRAQVTATGEVIIMPYIPATAQPIALAKVKAAGKATVRTIKPNRKSSPASRRNGYILMNGNQDWGTNYRLGHYGLAKLN